MSKPLYTVQPNNGKLYRFDGMMWYAAIAAGLPSFLDAGSFGGGEAQSGGSQAVPFVWRGRLWVAYFTIQEATRFRFVEVINVGSTPAYDIANMVATDPSDFGLADQQKVIFSNVEYYRGMVVRLVWPENTNEAYAVVFDDFNGDGHPDVRIHRLDGVPAAWTSWEAESTTYDADPHGGGHLFAHDQTLYWSPRGSFDRAATRVWDRLFRVDIRDQSAVMSAVPGTVDGGVARYPEWSSTTATPSTLSSLRALGMVRASLGAGSVAGKLFTVNANATVDLVDDLTSARTRAFDLRDGPGFVQATGVVPLSPTSTAPAQLRALRGDTLCPGTVSDRLNLCGGRVDITAGPRTGQQFDIIAMFRDGPSPAATCPVELKLTSPDTGLPTAALTPADVCTIRSGLLGTTHSAGAVWRGAPCSVQCLTYGAHAYIISGARRSDSGGSQGTAPLMVTRWDGALPASPTFLQVLPSVSASSLDCVIDEDAELLHILFHDVEAGLTRHAIVDLASFTVRAVSTVFATSGTSNIPAGVNPGALFAFSTYEPSAEIEGSPVFSPATRTVRIDYKLWSQMPGGLTNVGFRVEYNAGSGWFPATAHASSGPVANLTATATGTSQFFVHDIGNDLPTFIGPVQYRLTTFVP